VLAHKVHSEAGFQLVTMLATRKMSMKRIQYAAEKTRIAADHMERLVELLR
jgi:hypothetical protein